MLGRWGCIPRHPPLALGMRRDALECPMHPQTSLGGMSGMNGDIVRSDVYIDTRGVKISYLDFAFNFKF